MGKLILSDCYNGGIYTLEISNGLKFKVLEAGAHYYSPNKYTGLLIATNN